MYLFLLRSRLSVFFAISGVVGLLVGLYRVAPGQELQYPLAVAVDQNDVIYLADRNLPGIWQVKDGARSLYFAGSKKFRTPLNAVRCLAIDHDGRLLAGDSATREVYRFDAAGQPQPLTGGGIGIPMGVTVNSHGDLMVADLELHRVWKVPAAGGTPEEIAQIPAPRGVFVDADDRTWVISGVQDPLRRILPDGTVEVIVKDRPFQYPSAVLVDAQNNAYVCDSYSHAIWKVGPDGSTTKLVEGEPLVHPVGLAWRGADLLVVDPHAKALFQVDPSGKLTKVDLKPAVP